MLKDLVGDDVKINRKLEAIERNTVRASMIAKELLHFSSERATEFEPIDINLVVTTSCNLLKNQKNSSIIQLSLRDVPKVMGIFWKLEEVFINLLMNSIDACDKEDNIEIETFVENGSIMVMVTDTGHGIGEDDLFRVFDPFYTTKPVGKGTGLGLSVCYNIIKQHGGKISLVSSEYGGTIVTISFPVMTDEN